MSRLRKPISKSITQVFFPFNANPIPMLAAVVVLPTPPFPEVMHTTRESLPMLRVAVVTPARESELERVKTEPTLAAPSARLEALDRTNAICCVGWTGKERRGGRKAVRRRRSLTCDCDMMLAWSEEDWRQKCPRAAAALSLTSNPSSGLSGCVRCPAACGGACGVGQRSEEVF